MLSPCFSTHVPGPGGMWRSEVDVAAVFLFETVGRERSAIPTGEVWRARAGTRTRNPRPSSPQSAARRTAYPQGATLPRRQAMMLHLPADRGGCPPETHPRAEAHDD